MRGFGIVVGAAALSWLLLALPAALVSAEGPTVTVPAALVCLVPNLLALGVARLVRTKSPYTQVGVLLASFVIRPLVVVVLGTAVYFLFPPLRGRELSLLVWGAVFYLIILAAESYVVSRQMAGSTPGR